ncbi:restriction endonuclease subunit S [Massilimicrobiota timonensis]|uniref:restriction endonuclease subunit S n=1 Tax=Massilimicrobiota timonensis TaxID=1776392 RepID=UPI00101D8055|nr:restriction endonuclease subunit S [Massilimicrobiota timonensis]
MKVRVGDLTKIRTGKLDANASSETGEYPFFTCSKEPLKISTYSYDCECVLVAGNGDLNVKYYNGKFDAYQRTYIIEDNSSGKICMLYLYYYMESYIEELRKQSIGGVIKYIKLGNLTDALIELPSVYEQKAIVEILGKIKNIINKHNKEISNLDELIKARFVEMFGTLSDNENGFDVVIIDDVCSLIKDGTHQTPQYIEDKEEGYKFLSSKDVMSQKIDWSKIKYIPADLHEKLYATLKPQRNDILMSKNGVNYGVAAINDTDEVFDIYVSLALLRPKEMIDPIFFRCVINNPETKRQFDSSIKGVGVPNLHLSEIKKTKIFLPPMKLQKEFVNFVKQVDKSKFEVQKSLEKTQQLYDSLMQKYFG